MGIYQTAILVLVLLAIAFNQPRKRWKCPAPGCDFSVEADKEAMAKQHTLLHSKHQPALKEE